MNVNGEHHDTGRLGAWLRRARAAAGMTQEELAERSGMGVRMIGDLERGRTRRPYARSVRCLAASLGVPFPSQPWRDADPPVVAGAAGAAQVPPRQLPPSVRAFAGRTADQVRQPHGADLRDRRGRGGGQDRPGH